MDWISIEKDLPEGSKEVLVTIKDFDDSEWVEELGIARRWVTTATVTYHVLDDRPIWRQSWDGQPLENNNEAIIAWRPLPEPYKEKE